MILMLALSVTDLVNLIVISIVIRQNFFRLWWLKFIIAESPDDPRVSWLWKTWTNGFEAVYMCNVYTSA